MCCARKTGPGRASALTEVSPDSKDLEHALARRCAEKTGLAVGDERQRTAVGGPAKVLRQDERVICEKQRAAAGIPEMYRVSIVSTTGSEIFAIGRPGEIALLT